MAEPSEQQGFSISKIQVRSFLSAFILLFVLMAAAWALCFILPGGHYQREVVDGQTFVVPYSYAPAAGGLPFWKCLLSPFLCWGTAAAWWSPSSAASRRPFP